jgi:CheY-like chemotaxis protein
VARVLVVDDEDDLVRVVVKLMESRGHRVTTARDGQEALDRVAADPPDAVVLDINIPKIAGRDVCARLKADPATRRIPVVMMTAAPVALGPDDRLALPCDAFVMKPFPGELLCESVERLLARGA